MDLKAKQHDQYAIHWLKNETNPEEERKLLKLFSRMREKTSSSSGLHTVSSNSLVFSIVRGTLLG
jgi:hypothetical protein